MVGEIKEVSHGYTGSGFRVKYLRGALGLTVCFLTFEAASCSLSLFFALFFQIL